MSRRRVVHRLRYAHRHLTPGNLLGAAAAAGVLAVVVTGSLQLASGTTQPQGPASALPAAGSSPAPPVATRPQVLPALPPLHMLIRATVLVTSSAPLSDDVVRRAVALTGANASLLVAAGQVELGRGATTALATDPVKMRVWTPAATGRATGVWQRAVIGEAVVAHAVAQANATRLGGTALIRGSAASLRLRVGAFATTQLPGVGLVLNTDLGRRLGLLPRTGLLLAVADADPAVVAAVVGHALGPSATVAPVLSYQRVAGTWVPPAIGPITSPFGMRIHPITHQPEFHQGIDIGAPLGAPVYAMSDGQVLYAGPASGYGNEIVLSHPAGVSTLYGHLSQILVSSGPVKVGQVIGLVGNEGESTGPHLHAEVLVQDQPVDPVVWLSDHGVRFTR